MASSDVGGAHTADPTRRRALQERLPVRRHLPCSTWRHLDEKFAFRQREIEICDGAYRPEMLAETRRLDQGGRLTGARVTRSMVC